MLHVRHVCPHVNARLESRAVYVPIKGPLSTDAIRSIGIDHVDIAAAWTYVRIAAFRAPKEFADLSH